MTAQSTDAAERSAHVTRGPAAQDSASVVREWREDGKLVACAEGVARMRERVRELEGGATAALHDLWRLQDLWLASNPERNPPAAFLNSYFGAVNALRLVLGSPVKPHVPWKEPAP